MKRVAVCCGDGLQKKKRVAVAGCVVHGVADEASVLGGLRCTWAADEPSAQRQQTRGLCCGVADEPSVLDELRCGGPHAWLPFNLVYYAVASSPSLSTLLLLLLLLLLQFLHPTSSGCLPTFLNLLLFRSTLACSCRTLKPLIIVASFIRGVSEVMLRFWGVTASVVGTNSPLFGWIHLDVVLNKDFSYSSGLLSGYWLWSYVVEGLRVRKPLVLPVVALEFELRRGIVRWFSIDYRVTVSFIYGVAYLTRMVSFGIPRLICASFGIIRMICASFEVTRLICKGMTRGRLTRGKKDA
ncbi:hypothetical protein E5676_scaffold1737G00290 [Cucumis melo var. makuwa]|uniref:Transmembrane protein n=1 Tax=Cucumis melo var. makuwa TaxID=1194695 RepID=A0A5D3C749_CUCMM|nr:hypothetical protein E5676_scaffold1737G00290 [Cucumis melo var. makuwa]